MRKLHLGCSNTYPGPIDGWDNLDIRKWNKNIIVHDLRKPLPYKSNSVHACFSCHTLEHLTKQEGEKLLKECFRVLKKGMPIRIIVPSLENVLKLRSYDEIIKALYDPESKSGPHKYMYYNKSLIKAMKEAGFSQLEETDWRNQYSKYKVFKDISNFHAKSLAIEGAK